MKVQVVSQVAARRRGFTLVELVVVVLVLGIIAAVAAPKMFDTAKDARESSTKQSLSVVRAAIESYYSREGAYPTDLAEDLKEYLRGEFPKNQITGGETASAVTVSTSGTNLTADESGGWKYDSTTGQFIINSPGFDTL